jgi:RHH-type proline utilization regulon transcriptional repressor/proline dehydrogenase/delta 1-pyrroline-5-carboxylate dehydrogenase
VGDPTDPATDIGPVIDADAKGARRPYEAAVEGDAKIIARAALPAGADKGDLFAPTIAEIPTADYLEREVFGPVLHVCRYEPSRT